ncbi:MAG: class I SAM-dependent methyltransferase [Pseudomonadota bacterium]
MSYYDDAQNVEQYVQMADGYDGSELIKVLRTYLSDGSSVLELGMGPGKDLDLLSKHYLATGSDMSPAFIERYRAQNPKADLLLLDAASLDTQRQFDCIYSNKVLQHLRRQELAESFRKQAQRLKKGPAKILSRVSVGDRIVQWLVRVVGLQGPGVEQLGQAHAYLLSVSLTALQRSDYRELSLSVAVARCNFY